MNRTTKWIIAILILVVVVFFVVKGRSGKNKPDRVSVEKATKRTIIETVSTSGKIYPVTEIRVSPDFSGQIKELNVAEGDTVKKGQVLARVNDRTIEASIDGIVLSLKVKKGESVTGNTFSIGTEIMTIADMSVLEIRTDVGENDIIKVNIGDTAEVTVDAYNNRKFRGVVSSIANTTRTSGPGFNTGGDITNYEVRIRLDTSSFGNMGKNEFPFRPGMNASAEIRTKKLDHVLSVPISSVTTRVKDSEKSLDEKKKEDKQENGENDDDTDSRDQLDEVVFLMQKDGTVKKIVVKTGIQDINYIEIQSGLNEGDEVVTGPYSALSRTLKNGMKVKVVAKDKLFE